MLHVLMHIAFRTRVLTSEQIASVLETNPVVVRRTMAALREAGYGRSVAGQGGGWPLSCDLSKTSLLDIHSTLGEPHVFAIRAENPHPGFAVGRSVNIAVRSVLEEAEEIIMERLSKITSADIADDFSALYAQTGGQGNILVE